MQDVEELLGLPPEKVLLKWMNFQLKKAGYKKEVTNFSSDLKVRGSSHTLDTVVLCVCSILAKLVCALLPCILYRSGDKQSK